MTIEIASLLLLLAAIFAVLLSGRARPDVTALVALAMLMAVGYLSPSEGFSGFSSTAVVTMFCMFFLSGALRETGVADWMGHCISRLARGRERWELFGIVLVTAGFSSVMNNVAAAALMMPAALAVSHASRRAPSRVLLPVAFGALLGGMLTVIGTPPNLLAAEMLRVQGIVPFSLLSFTPFGALAVAFGAVFFWFFGPEMLPQNPAPYAPALGDSSLPDVYRLYERVFSLRVVPGSSLVNKPLGRAELASLLGARVIAIMRDGKANVMPRATDLLQENDRLVVGGRREEVEALLRFEGVKVERVAPRVQWSGQEVCAAKYLAGPSEIGEKLAALQRGSINLLGVEHRGRLRYSALSERRVERGDLIRLVASRAELEALANSTTLVLQGELSSVETLLHDQVFVVHIPVDSVLAGVSLESSGLEQLFGVGVIGTLENETASLRIRGEALTLQADQRLLVVGDTDRVTRIAQFGKLEFIPDYTPPVLESSEVAVVEVALAPRSQLIERSLRELAFRDRYDFVVLALWRQGRPIRTRFEDLPLRFGDALLIQGPREKIALFAADPDFVLISQSLPQRRRKEKAPFAIGALGLLLLLEVFDLQPIEVASMAAAMIVVLSGALRMEELYRDIEWRIVFFVAALLPLGIAMERSGALQWCAATALSGIADVGPMPLLLALAALSSLISQLLDGSLSVLLLAPIAIASARYLGASPYPFVMMVALSASLAFMTPFSHKANLLVMAAGGYRTRDYLIPGTIVTVVLLVLFLVTIPLLFPFFPEP